MRKEQGAKGTLPIKLEKRVNNMSIRRPKIIIMCTHLVTAKLDVANLIPYSWFTSLETRLVCRLTPRGRLNTKPIFKITLADKKTLSPVLGPDGTTLSSYIL